MKRRLWKEEEISFLFKTYPNNPTFWIAQQLNRSVKSIYSAAHIHKLDKSPEYLNTEQSGRKIKGCTGNSHSFQKGHIPTNKGQKMSKGVYDKVQKTMFKKGHKPHNTKQDGYERIDTKDGYIYIRHEGKFKLKHRLVWEQHNGSIPPGHMIKFKDKNPLNVDIDNLYMTDRVSNMQDNTIHRYPPVLKSVIKLRHKLNRTIHEKQD